jgi:tetratricopeptide (TPR) repeat protein
MSSSNLGLEGSPPANPYAGPGFDEAVKELTEDYFEYRPNPLETPQVAQERFKTQVSRNLEKDLEMTKKGIELLLSGSCDIIDLKDDKVLGQQFATEIRANVDKQEQTFSEPVLDLFFDSATELYEKLEFRDSITAFEALLELDPNNYQVWLMLGNSHQMLDEFEDSKIFLETASQLRPEDPDPVMKMAYAHLETSGKEAATPLIQEAKALIEANKEEYGRHSEFIDFLETK